MKISYGMISMDMVIYYCKRMNAVPIWTKHCNKQIDSFSQLSIRMHAKRCSTFANNKN